MLRSQNKVFYKEVSVTKQELGVVEVKTIDIPFMGRDWFDEHPLVVEGAASKENAYTALTKAMEEEEEINLDNFRFAFLNDAQAVKVYFESLDDGCCGFYDVIVVFNDGRLAIVGCNHGH